MSLWNKIKDAINFGNFSSAEADVVPSRRDAEKYAFADIELSLKDNRIRDIGALRYDGAVFHKNSKSEFAAFIDDVDFLCGHNIVHHDWLLQGLQA